jgi:hypothetical protein
MAAAFHNNYRLGVWVPACGDDDSGVTFLRLDGIRQLLL